MSACPTPDVLQRLLDSAGPGATLSDGWTQHVEQCPRCRAELERLRTASIHSDMTAVLPGEGRAPAAADPEATFASLPDVARSEGSQSASEVDQTVRLSETDFELRPQPPANPPDDLDRTFVSQDQSPQNEETTNYEPGAPKTDGYSDTLVTGAGSSGATDEQSRGRLFGGYELVSELGRGGMGIVYKARDVSLDRLVALKVMRAGEFASEGDRRRFEAEARAAGHLNHPGLVGVYDYGIIDGNSYLVMPFIEGQSLSAQLADGPLAARHAAQLMKEICDGMDYAHSHGVIHRDLKPANIIMDPAGKPHITDFGLAKRTEVESHVTATGAILGTPSYMPPEQIGSMGLEDGVGTWSDVYSLGAMLYALLIGRPPFQGSSVVETLRQVTEQQPVPLRQLNGQIPVDLETICLKCLEKQPKLRYASAADLRDDLKRFLDYEPIVARPPSLPDRVVKFVRRHPGLTISASTIALLLLALAGGSAVFAAYANRQREAQSKLAESNANLATENAEQRDIAVQERDRAERITYAAQIRLANSAIGDGDLQLANDTLYETSADLRGWEWHYLASQGALDSWNLIGKGAPIVAVAFRPDGQRIAAGDRAGNILEFDARSHEIVRTISTGTSAVRCVAYHPDGTLLAAAGADQLVRLWNLDTGEPAQPPHSLSAPVSSLWFSDSGEKLLAQEDGGAMHVWSTATGEPLLALPLENSKLQSAVIAPDGEFAYSVSSGTGEVVNRWDTVRGGPPLWTVAEPGATVPAIDPQATQLAIGTNLGSLAIRMCNTGALRWSGYSHAGPVNSVQFSRPRGDLLATSSTDGTIHLWDVSRPSEPPRNLMFLRTQEQWANQIRFNETGSRLASANENGTVTVWDIVSRRRAREVLDSQIARTRAVAFRRDGDSFAVLGDSDSPAQIWDVHTGVKLLSLPAVTHGLGASFHPRGDVLAVLHQSPEGGRISLIDVVTGATQLSVPAHLPASSLVGRAVAFDADGFSFWGTAPGPVVTRWDVRTGDVLASWDSLVFEGLDVSGLRAVAVEPAAGQGSRVVLLDASAPQDRIALADPVNATCVALSPDGTLVAASNHSNIVLWDTATRTRLRELTGHTAAITSLRFHPVGNRLLSTSLDRTVRLWSAPGGSELIALPEFSAEVWAADFSPDGDILAAGGQDGAIQVWDASDSLTAPQLPDRSLLTSAEVRRSTAEWLHVAERFWKSQDREGSFLAMRRGVQQGAAEFMNSAWIKEALLGGDARAEDLAAYRELLNEAATLLPDADKHTAYLRIADTFRLTKSYDEELAALRQAWELTHAWEVAAPLANAYNDPASPAYDPAAAIAVVKQCAEEGGGPEVWEHLSLLQEARGDRAAALDAMRNCFQTYSQSYYASMAQMIRSPTATPPVYSARYAYRLIHLLRAANEPAEADTAYKQFLSAIRFRPPVRTASSAAAARDSVNIYLTHWEYGAFDAAREELQELLKSRTPAECVKEARTLARQGLSAQAVMLALVTLQKDNKLSSTSAYYLAAVFALAAAPAASDPAATAAQWSSLAQETSRRWLRFQALEQLATAERAGYFGTNPDLLGEGTRGNIPALEADEDFAVLRGSVSYQEFVRGLRAKAGLR